MVAAMVVGNAPALISAAVLGALCCAQCVCGAVRLFLVVPPQATSRPPRTSDQTAAHQHSADRTLLAGGQLRQQLQQLAAVGIQ
jgi:hypothetical protein